MLTLRLNSSPSIGGLFLSFWLSLFLSVSALAQAGATLASEEMARGAKLLEAGDNRGAVEAFKAATKKQKENAEAWNSLGVAQFRNNNFKEARKAFERAVKIRPDFASAHAGLAYVLHRTGKFNDAVRKAQ